MIDYGFINTPTGPATFRDEPDHEPPVKGPEPDIMSPTVYINSIDRLGFREKLGAMEREVDALVVTDDETAARAVAMAGQVAALGNRIKKASEIKLAPFKSIINSVREFCLPLEKQCADLKRKAERKNRDYLIECENKRIAAEREAAEQARKLQEQQATNEPVATVPIVPHVPSKTVIKTPDGSQTCEFIPVGTLVDFRKLPDECIKDRWDKIVEAVQPWINIQVKAGNHNIPGVVVSKQPKQTTRSRR